MSFWKRAFLYVTRKKGKSILLFTILLIMATLVLTGLAVGKGSERAQDNLRQALGGEFQLMVNYSEDNPYFKVDKTDTGGMVMYSEMPITHDDISSIMSIEGIESFDAFTELLLTAEGIKLIPGNIPIEDEFRTMTNTQIVGGTEASNYFRSGQVYLVEGNHIESADNHVALISKGLAEKNGLSVGDTLSFQSDGSVEVTIIGFFEVNDSNRIGTQVTSYDKLENKIFLDLDSLHNLVPDRTAGFDTVVFRAKDPAQIDSIVTQVKNMTSIDWRAYTLETNNQTYVNAAAPLSKLNTLVKTLLIVVVAVSAIILSLTLTMWAKSRIHETGVFLSVGIRKSSIVGQYLVEVLLIAIIAFGLSYFTSNAISNQIGNGLLQQGVQVVDEQDDDVRNGAVAEALEAEVSGEENPTFSKVENIQVAIVLDNMIQLYLIGFVIIILSVGASSAVVMRLKPRDILSKMS